MTSSGETELPDWLRAALSLDIAQWVAASVWLADCILTATQSLLSPWSIAANVVVTGLCVASVVLSRRLDPYEVESWNPDACSVAIGLPVFVAVTIALAAVGIHPRGLAPAIGTAAWLGVTTTAAILVEAPRRPNGKRDFHVIPYGWRKRKPLYKWSPQRLTEHVHEIYYGSSETGEGQAVEAVVVFHQNPELLPAWVSRQRDFKPWLVEQYYAGPMELVGFAHGSVETAPPAGEGFSSEAEAQARAAGVAAELGLTLSEDGRMPRVLAAGFLNHMTNWTPSFD